MTEFFPFAAGLLVGLALGALRPPWRAPVGAGLVATLGALATILSGEYRISWEFLLVDVPLTATAAVLGFAGIRVLRLYRGRRSTSS